MTVAAASVAAMAAHGGLRGHVDLHGLTVGEAIKVVDSVLSSSGLGRGVHAGGALTFITGKGIHSGAAGPRLKHAVRGRLEFWGAVYTDADGGFSVPFVGDPWGRQPLAQEAARWPLDSRLRLDHDQNTSGRMGRVARRPRIPAAADAAPPGGGLPPASESSTTAGLGSFGQGTWLLTLVVGKGGVLLWVT